MAILKDSDKKEVEKRLSVMNKPVKIILFKPESDIVVPGRRECMYCKEVTELMQDLVDTSDKLSLEIVDPEKDTAKAEKYGLKKDLMGYMYPAITFTVADNNEEKHYNIWFYGLPAGYEFATMLDDIIMLSTGELKLSEALVPQVSNIDKKVVMDVFVTPTCPYCPKAVLAAHQFAYVNPNFVSSMIEASEFEDLTNRWNVYGVPKTVINEKVEVEGAVPENMFLDYVRNALA
ncbi:protein disulfide oxidoreductase [Coprothermobacter platensis]|uniref:protein disulfide oxidoreductase n=1 Tax=Coprothermobacter platensis TaxID=108819 RepID=UPI00035F7B24|nr:thioredoxin family protein [Coprothermobacter platensis]